MTGYQQFTFLEKAWYLLRPINVPFKNKWIRDTISSLKLNQNFKDPHLLKFILHHILSSLDCIKFKSIKTISQSILNKIIDAGFSSDSPYIDLVAIVAITLKILYAFNDRENLAKVDLQLVQRVKILVN